MTLNSNYKIKTKICTFLRGVKHQECKKWIKRRCNGFEFRGLCIGFSSFCSFSSYFLASILAMAFLKYSFCCSEVILKNGTKEGSFSMSLSKGLPERTGRGGSDLPKTIFWMMSVFSSNLAILEEVESLEDLKGLTISEMR